MKGLILSKLNAVVSSQISHDQLRQLNKTFLAERKGEKYILSFPTFKEHFFKIMVLLFSLNSILVLQEIIDTLTSFLFLGVPSGNDEEIQLKKSHLIVPAGICYLFCVRLCRVKSTLRVQWCQKFPLQTQQRICL